MAGFYFARPYCSWERGLSEHTNGLVRQYFPKAMDFIGLDDARVRQVQDLLNGRPRRVLSYRTPAEVFGEALDAAKALLQGSGVSYARVTLQNQTDSGTTPRLATCTELTRRT